MPQYNATVQSSATREEGEGRDGEEGEGRDGEEGEGRDVVMMWEEHVTREEDQVTKEGRV